MNIRLNIPCAKDEIRKIHAGDTILLSGTIYTGRDAAHKRMIEMLDEGKELPFNIRDAAIYYTGPCPAKPGMPIGSCGPTTSYRMDSFTPRLLNAGLLIMIGKGNRSEEVIKSMMDNTAVYLGATGGAGALLSSCVKSCEIIAFNELMSEAIRRLLVVDMPLICTIDAFGKNLYK